MRSSYVVWPLEAEELKLYTTAAFALRPGYLIVEAETATKAALAVRGDTGAHSVRRFAVLGLVEGPDGPTVRVSVIDFEVIEGRETLTLDEQPHRAPWERPSHTGDDGHDDLSDPARPA